MNAPASPTHRIVLVHAVAVAIAPIVDAFATRWPAADVVNLLEDSLSRDRASSEDLSPAMYSRFADLTRYALAIGGDGVLFTCSAFGAAIEAARAEADVPMLKPNEAMFEDALATGRRIGMLATFEPSVASMEREFREAAATAGAGASIESVCVPEAMRALAAGDTDTHDRLLAAAAPRLADRDAIMLAQFSTSRARGAVEGVVDVPVLTSPASAVEKLRAALAA